MECSPNSIACRLEQLDATLSAGPSDWDIAGFWVSAVTAIFSVVIAVVAVALSLKSARESKKREKLLEEQEQRRRRAEFAHDVAMWFNSGSVLLMLPADALTEAEVEWVDAGESILFKARTFEHPFANKLMQGAKELRRSIPSIDPIDKRMRAVSHVTSLFKYVASEWVVDPDTFRDIDFSKWLDDEWLADSAAE